MITVQEALQTILNEVRPLGAEPVGISGAMGRVVSEDVAAKVQNPAWDNSAMDGYAVLANDLSSASKDAPVRLKVIYDLPAGGAPSGPVKGGEAVRIMTGAPMPDGATAVVMVENTEIPSPGFVDIRASARRGENIRKAGEDFKAGDIVIKKGSIIRPAELGMLAAIGAAEVRVYKRPKVAIVSTGEELMDITERPSHGKIYNSNGYALSGLVSNAGCDALQLGIARDTKEDLTRKFKEALSADVVITSGGVSVGDYDFVKDVLKELGSSMMFWKVAIKPGKPLVFGVMAGRPAFGLPGNPISSMVSFEQFVRPALLKMAGHEDIFRKTVKARLTKDIKIKPGRMNFIRAEVKITAEGFEATPLEGQGSGMLSSMVRANSFIVAPLDSTGFKKGDNVTAQLFDASALMDSEPGY